jgi:very-short-patch-repair endonuclease
MIIELVLSIASIIIIVAIVMKVRDGIRPLLRKEKKADVYHYSRKEAIMTETETVFYRRLMSVAGERYLIFPQIHLSALLSNQTGGRYHRAAFQRINGMSVDYVLCDKESLKAVYAIELDDRTHDTPKRQARDAKVERMLSDAGLPLVRFKNSRVSDDEIIHALTDAHTLVAQKISNS